MKTQRTFIILLLLCITSTIVSAQTVNVISKKMICKKWYADSYTGTDGETHPVPSESKNNYIKYNADSSMIFFAHNEAHKGRWTFDSTSQKITMRQNYSYIDSTVVFTIIKLTEKEMNVKTKVNNDRISTIHYKAR